MASTYAHYKFAHNVYDRLPPEIKQLVKRNLQLYDIGLHGPDVLFYYKPLLIRGISKIGYDLHKQPARAFFNEAREVIRKSGCDERYTAYILGFITHFVLDTAVHSYIVKCSKCMTARHIEIEVEYDRELLTREGRNPLREKLTRHLCATDENAEVVVRFWKTLTAKKVKKAISSMCFYCNFFVTESRFKRSFVNGAFKLIGKYDELKGLFVNPEANPECKNSNEQLDLRFNAAIDIAVETIKNYYAQLLSDEPLDEIFDRTFDDNGKDL